MTSVHQISPWGLDERTHTVPPQAQAHMPCLPHQDLVQEALPHPQKNEGQAFNMVGAISSSSETLPEAAKGREILKLKLSGVSALC